MAVETTPISNDFWKSCLLHVKDNGKDIGDVVTIGCVPQLVQLLIEAALRFAGIVAVFLIIWGGIKFIRSGGDPKQAEGARQTMTYAIIGLVIVMLAYFIISVLAQVTGLGCLKVFGFEQCAAKAGDYGCFYGETKSDGSTIDSKSCYEYSIDNDPKIPLQWFHGNNAESECNDYCGALK